MQTQFGRGCYLNDIAGLVDPLSMPNDSQT